MKNQRDLIFTTISSLLALGITASSGAAYAGEEERCFGVAKAGQNACNTNANKHACAGHSRSTMTQRLHTCPQRHLREAGRQAGTCRGKIQIFLMSAKPSRALPLSHDGGSHGSLLKHGKSHRDH